MLDRHLRSLQVDYLAAFLDSITGFGHHRSHTDIFVPHPGPWIHPAPPDDLATRLEHVMGPSSHASVLTDNEPTQGFGQALIANIDAINAAHAGDPGYDPPDLHRDRGEP
ncbi:hypothetical protein ACWDXD_20820 [Streptomyces sp. NPDC003314]